MVIENYPICDCDIWIKHCKYEHSYNENLIFSLYDRVYMSDAVVQELIRERDITYESFIEDFNLGKTKFREENNKRIHVIHAFSNLFDDDMKKALRRSFSEKEIYFQNHKYIGTKQQLINLGEKVTIIFASILEIPVILSDDFHCKTGVNSILDQFPYLNVLTLVDLLKKYNPDLDFRSIIHNVNKPLSSLTSSADDFYYEQPAISSQTYKPDIISYKNKFNKSSNN